MNNFNLYIVSYNTYKNYIKENKNNRITKFDKISVHSIYNDLNKIDEIFDTDIPHLDFELFQQKNDFGSYDYRYIFKTEKNNKYTLDLIKKMEKNTDLKNSELHNNLFISVSFSVVGVEEEEYNEQTFKNEQYDIFNRIKYLLSDFKNKYLKKDEIFMFGLPIDIRRKNMYKYFIGICFKDYGIKTDFSSYFDGNKAIYLIKK